MQKYRELPILVVDRQYHPLLCRSVLGPRAALRSCTEIPSGGIVNQSGSPPERKMIMSSFRDQAAIAIEFRRPGRRSSSVNRRIKKRRGRTPPINHNESGGTDLTKSSLKADLAFRRAMQHAIAHGLERPPRIGVRKDARPLIAPRLFDPVPHASGCTSPALECAELMARSH